MSKLDWHGEQVVAEVEEAVKKALGEIGLRVEGHAKRQLYKVPRHGVLTGTLRRSIHTAPVNYNWSGDDVIPSPSTPELGGKSVPAEKDENGLAVSVGSGMRYALPVHQGHGKFKGYHFLTIGLDKAKKEIPEVLNKYALKDT